MYVGLRVKCKVSSKVKDIGNNPNIKVNDNPVADLRMRFACSLAILIILSFIKITVMMMIIIIIIIIIKLRIDYHENNIKFTVYRKQMISVILYTLQTWRVPGILL
jgi:hypothetical protein